MNYNADLYICKQDIASLVHKTFKPLRKPMTFYNSLHHIVNELYGNDLMHHHIVAHKHIRP